MESSANYREQVRDHLNVIYGAEAEGVLTALLERIDTFQSAKASRRPSERLSERDIVLISYGDQIRQPDEAPLKTLHSFMKRYLDEAITALHILPFYPYTSDDGFSVVDYLAVDPELGDWQDVEAIGDDYRLMFDAVINHISASSAWFQEFLAGEPPYRDYFITEDPETDLSRIVRPRTTPLLTPFETADGRQHVWTTFSEDQIDLNYENPAVLLEVVDVLLDYVKRGAEIIRLDAVTYLWKEVGHESVHHPKTHRVLQLFRSVLEAAAPQVVVLTETNVPHDENMSYFGNGYNEAQMVYNFALPPLTLYSYASEDASALQAWARELKTPSDETTFFNFLASHDGIGVRPVEAILGREGIDVLVKHVQDHGGLVSFKTNSDGSQSPYELNINYFDALNRPRGEARDLQVKRFVGAHSIMMTLQGVPGIYIHSLLGSRSDHAGVARTGRNRSINREKFALERLESELEDPNGLRCQVLNALGPLLKLRQQEPAFHPQAKQRVLDTGPKVFGLERYTESTRMLCLHNVTPDPQTLSGLLVSKAQDLISGQAIEGPDVVLEPLETRWLKLT